MFKRNLYFTVLITFVFFTLTGCGKENVALNTYKDEMSSFCADINEQNDIINAIDPTSETATEDLLASLDILNEEFTALAEMEVPEEFTAVETLADEAGSYMTDAVNMYHYVFSADEFDNASLEVANENYNRAIKRIQYIGDILVGNIPDGEDVSVSYEDVQTGNEDISE